MRVTGTGAVPDPIDPVPSLLVLLVLFVFRRVERVERAFFFSADVGFFLSVRVLRQQKREHRKGKEKGAKTRQKGWEMWSKGEL